MRHLLLIRHSESLKNIGSEFSQQTEIPGYSLTQSGTLVAQSLSKLIENVVKSRNFQVQHIYTSSSNRSITTAEIIADRLGVSVWSSPNLISIGSGVLSGKTEYEAKKTHPDYIAALQLYRSGLFNSYNIPTFAGKEDKHEFEVRVNSEIARIIDVSDETLKLVIGHRSQITAVLIDYARRFHEYPRDFFGYIQLDIGRISWIREITHNNWQIARVNASPDEIMSLLVDDI